MSALTLIVFARRPRPGRVKRRLARGIGSARACRVYALLLMRTLAELERFTSARRVVMPAAHADARWFRAHCRRRGWRVRPQRRGNLGQRMYEALKHEADGRNAVILVGSDIADFCADDICNAGRALQRGDDVVLGPAADGGYWLIGMRRPQAALFNAIEWSSERVSAQTLAAAAAAGLALTTTPQRHDIDRARDLRWLSAWRAQRRRARSRSSCAT